jgi:hypothetical protein
MQGQTLNSEFRVRFDSHIKGLGLIAINLIFFAITFIEVVKEEKMTPP